MSRKRAAFIVAVLCVATAIWLTRPRPNQLVWYTTPALDSIGTRVKLLIPSGWVPSWETVMFTNGEKVFTIHERRAWPAWLQRWKFLQPEDAGIVLAALKGDDRSAYYNDIGEDHNPHISYYQRTEVYGRGCTVLYTYFRANRAAFTATRAQVLKSVQVIPGEAQ